MGICGSSLSEAEQTEINDAKRMDELLREKQHTEQRVVKILLLGTGESGKSTIFKQMQILYDQDGFNDNEKEFFRTTIRHNVVESMQTLLSATIDKFAFQFKDAESDAAAAYLRPLDWYKQGFWTDDIVLHVKQLWLREPAIRQAFERRSEYQLIDSAGYLFDNVERIGERNFIPRAEDCLRARHRTSGIVERMFVIEGVRFKFIDVGGQRNERRKWIHCFEDVTCVMFVAAISEYDQTLYEDEKKNRMVESLEVFNKIINEKTFQNSTILLFLNKTDLFADKLKKAHLRNTFPEYKGDNSFEDAAGFIERQYLKQQNDPNSSRTIYSHFTCATDTTNVEKVFVACKQTILQQNLRRLGLAPE